MFHKVLGSPHNLCNARLVVCAKQRCAVCCNYGASGVPLHLRKVRNLKADILALVKHNISTIVVLNNLRLYISSRCIRCGICVRYETYCGDLPLRHVGWDGAHHISPLIHLCLYAHSIKFIPEHSKQVKLATAARLALRIGIRSGLNGHISQKLVKYLFHSKIYFLSEALIR